MASLAVVKTQRPVKARLAVNVNNVKSTPTSKSKPSNFWQVLTNPISTGVKFAQRCLHLAYPKTPLAFFATLYVISD